MEVDQKMNEEMPEEMIETVGPEEKDSVHILKLDDHILDKIMSLVYNRRNASLVCKKFYEAVCRAEKFKKKLMLDRWRPLVLDPMVNRDWRYPYLIRWEMSGG